MDITDAGEFAGGDGDAAAVGGEAAPTDGRLLPAPRGRKRGRKSPDYSN